MKLKNRYREFAVSATLWRGALKTVEGRQRRLRPTWTVDTQLPQPRYNGQHAANCLAFLKHFRKKPHFLHITRYVYNCIFIYYIVIYFNYLTDIYLQIFVFPYVRISVLFFHIPVFPIFPLPVPVFTFFRIYV